MSDKFTPGPWTVVLAKGSYQRPALVMAGDKTVASCLGNQLEPEATSIGEATANARLIAAAPDLLALAEGVAEYFAGTDAPLGERARAAIAKAEGR